MRKPNPCPLGHVQIPAFATIHVTVRNAEGKDRRVFPQICSECGVWYTPPAPTPTSATGTTPWENPEP